MHEAGPEEDQEGSLGLRSLQLGVYSVFFFLDFYNRDLAVYICQLMARESLLDAQSIGARGADIAPGCACLRLGTEGAQKGNRDRRVAL